MQMIVFSYILAVVFALNQPIVTLGAALALVVVAAIVTQNQISQRIPDLLPIVLGSLLVASGVTLGYVQIFVIQSNEGLTPRIVIPLVGLVLAAAMNGTAIAGEQFVQALNHNVQEIETHLSLGASPALALDRYRKDAIRAALTPTLSLMTVAGLATVPNVMAGELLAGFDPLQAGAYQLLVLLMALLATLISTLLLLGGLARQFFNAAQQHLRW